jgi:hypothetical protein
MDAEKFDTPEPPQTFQSVQSSPSVQRSSQAADSHPVEDSEWQGDFGTTETSESSAKADPAQDSAVAEPQAIEESDPVQDSQKLEAAETVQGSDRVDDTEPVEDTVAVEETELPDDSRQMEDVQRLSDAQPIEESQAIEEPDAVEDFHKVEVSEAVQVPQSVDDSEPVEDTVAVEETELPDESQQMEDVQRLSDAQPIEESQAIEEPDPVEDFQKAEASEAVQGPHRVDDSEPVEDTVAVEETELADDSQQMEDVQRLSDAQPIEESQAIEEPDPGEDFQKAVTSEAVQDPHRVDDSEPVEGTITVEELERADDYQQIEDVQRVEDAQPTEESPAIEEPDPGEEPQKVESSEAVKNPRPAENSMRVEESAHVADYHRVEESVPVDDSDSVRAAAARQSCQDFDAPDRTKNSQSAEAPFPVRHVDVAQSVEDDPRGVHEFDLVKDADWVHASQRVGELQHVDYLSPAQVSECVRDFERIEQSHHLETRDRPEELEYIEQPEPKLEVVQTSRPAEEAESAPVEDVNAASGFDLIDKIDPSQDTQPEHVMQRINEVQTVQDPRQENLRRAAVHETERVQMSPVIGHPHALQEAQAPPAEQAEPALQESLTVSNVVNAALAADHSPDGVSEPETKGPDTWTLAIKADKEELARAELQKQESEKNFAAELEKIVEDWEAKDALGAGQMLGRLDHAESIEATQVPQREMSAAEQALVTQMLADRRQQGLDRILTASPALHETVTTSEAQFGATGMTLRDWATENPEQIIELFDTWQNDGSIRSERFEKFVDVRMREFRGLEGERRLAFTVGANALMVQAPGRVNEPGIDLIIFREGRIELRDNKAIGAQRALNKVSALEWNLPQNLAEATKAVRDYVAQGESDLPPLLTTFVLPRMEAATEAIAEWVDANRDASLKSANVQLEFAAILKQHDIIRIVNFEAAAANARMSEGLRRRGFERGIE